MLPKNKLLTKTQKNKLKKCLFKNQVQTSCAGKFDIYFKSVNLIEIPHQCYV